MACSRLRFNSSIILNNGTYEPTFPSPDELSREANNRAHLSKYLKLFGKRNNEQSSERQDCPRHRASRGIGRAIAGRLAADGALVAVHYGKNRNSADEVVTLIKEAGGEAFAIGEDLKEPGSAARLFDKF